MSHSYGRSRHASALLFQIGLDVKKKKPERGYTALEVRKPSIEEGTEKKTAGKNSVTVQKVESWEKVDKKVESSAVNSMAKELVSRWAGQGVPGYKGL